METTFSLSDRDDTFDRFVRHFLTVRNRGEIPNKSEVYVAFKRFYELQRRGLSVEQILADLCRSASHFAAIALGIETNPRLVRSFDSLAVLGTEVVVPFLLPLYA